MRLLFILGFMASISACEAQTKPIKFGKDACNHCRMIISDPRFGAELVTTKGKVYMFDDLNCYWNFRKEQKIQESDIAHSVVVFFNKPGTFGNAGDACFLASREIRSPMGSGVAAFDTKEACAAHPEAANGKQLSWEAVSKVLSK